MKIRAWLPLLAELRSDTPIAFEMLDARRQVTRRDDAVPGALPKGVPCELLLHPFDVLLAEVRLPKLTGAKLAAALPSLVEEYVAGDIERNHVVASTRDANNRAVAAAVDRALLTRALELFRRAGVIVDSASPAVLGLAWTQGRWRVALREGYGMVRTGRVSGAGFASQGDCPVELKLLRAQSAGAAADIEVEGDFDTAAWSEALGEPVATAATVTQAPVVEIDLLQYGFAREVIGWKQWRRTLILCGVLCAVALGGLNAVAWQMRARETTVREAMTKLVKEVMPDVPVVLDPIAQLTRYVADLRAGAGTDRGEFLSLVTRLGGVADPDTIQSIDFGGGQFRVKFKEGVASSAESRARLTERAVQAGLELRFEGDGARLLRKDSP